MSERHISVSKTARYFLAGSPALAAEVWYVLHGYGQLAESFLRRFLPLAEGGRCLVAPEALSRFYLETGSNDRIGASWMTRADRLTEIMDYVRYLDALHDEVRAARSDAGARTTVLGFSQGTATAARWLAMGRCRAQHLILWGGEVPPDLDLGAARDAWRHTALTLVVGREDRYITEKVLARDEARLREAGIACRIVRFAGGHEIVAEVLAQLVA